jgi:hypothetical protein
MAPRIADYGAGRPSGPGWIGPTEVVPIFLFLCPNPYCHYPRLAKGFAWSPARVAVQLGVCERTDRDAVEALLLIEEHSRIAV